MKKLVISLLCCAVITQVQAAERCVITPWKDAVLQSDTDALRILWENNDKKVPVDQELSTLAVMSPSGVLETLIDLAASSQPPMCVKVLTEKAIAKDKSWMISLGFFAQMGRIDECKKIMQRGLSPYDPVRGDSQGNMSNLFEYLIASQHYANIHELKMAAEKMGYMYTPERVDVLKVVDSMGKGQYAALRYVLHHNLFEVQKRVNDDVIKPSDRAPFLVWIANRMHAEDDVNQDALMAELLLKEYGANPNLRHTKTGATALHLAILKDKENLVKILRKYGADETIKDNNGDTSRDALRKVKEAKVHALLAALSRGGAGVPDDQKPDECKIQ